VSVGVLGTSPHRGRPRRALDHPVERRCLFSLEPNS
jgi:hypothetical protein